MRRGNKNTKCYSPFKGVYKNKNRYAVDGQFKDENGATTYHYKSFDREVDAARAYNDIAAERYGLAARINTVPVPGLECLGNCEWELGSHYFTKEDLEPKD